MSRGCLAAPAEARHVAPRRRGKQPPPAACSPWGGPPSFFVRQSVDPPLLPGQSVEFRRPPSVAARLPIAPGPRGLAAVTPVCESSTSYGLYGQAPAGKAWLQAGRPAVITGAPAAGVLGRAGPAPESAGEQGQGLDAGGPAWCLGPCGRTWSRVRRLALVPESAWVGLGAQSSRRWEPRGSAWYLDPWRPVGSHAENGQQVASLFGSGGTYPSRGVWVCWAGQGAVQLLFVGVPSSPHLTNAL
uniref:Uncharacterized protein n=1 Tax=Rousettus aegyptiacus TaxID=9407 RepID=A0A7J8F0M6_ROUAE|nr:hypothetical protein HJG63_012188 [Rousettus aegyptiacus]